MPGTSSETADMFRRSRLVVDIGTPEPSSWLNIRVASLTRSKFCLMISSAVLLCSRCSFSRWLSLSSTSRRNCTTIVTPPMTIAETMAIGPPPMAFSVRKYVSDPNARVTAIFVTNVDLFCMIDLRTTCHLRPEGLSTIVGTGTDRSLVMLLRFRFMEPRESPPVIVVGAGIIGLTTAVVLAEAGIRVTVIASDPPERTVSAQAGAIWNPHLMRHPLARRWWNTGLARFRELAERRDTGVRLVRGREVFRNRCEVPQRISDTGDHVALDPESLPEGFAAGWSYTAPIIDMASYLDFLKRLLASRGVRITLGVQLDSLDSVARSGEILVNCTGLRARELVPDPAVRPIGGQMVIVSNPGIDEFFIDADGTTCFFPQGNVVVLGGSETPYESDVPDPVAAQRIRRDCSRIDPRLEAAGVVGHKVGVRPYRPDIRVERDRDNKRLLHNYGHGGAGITVSWGCAEEVKRIVRTTDPG